MRIYIFKRLLLIVPTLFLILLINFAVIQIAPGGPVEQAIQQAEAMQTLGNLGGAGGGSNVYQGAQGLSDEMLAKIKAHYGFDQPMHIRFFEMVKITRNWTSARAFLKTSPLQR